MQSVRSVGYWLRGATVLSHGAVLVSRLVGRRASGRAQGGSQGAEEAGQQCKAESPPGTEHGPTVAVANVLREAVHVGWIAG